MIQCRAVVVAATFLALAADLASAAPRKAEPVAAQAGEDYQPLRDVIAVTAGGRERSPPTATCLVWVDAEGFGWGPAQLNGRRGLGFTLNPKPMPGEWAAPTSFASAFAAFKAGAPALPAWLARLVEANGPKIEAACQEDHLDPVVIHTIKASDTKG